MSFSPQNQVMLNRAIYVLMALMVLVGVNQAVSAYYNAHPHPATLTQHTITLSATGKSVGVPDIAKVTVSVTKQANTVADVTTQGNQAMQAVIATIKKAGVADKDIKTTGYNLNPQYNYSVQPYKLTHYELTQSVEVKVRKLDDVSQIIDQATKAGANSVGTPSFEIDNPDAVQAKAEAEAFTQVRAKAKALAQASGINVGNIITFSEQQPSQPTPYSMFDAQSAKTLGSAPDTAPTPTIQPGSQDVEVQISATFELND